MPSIPNTYKQIRRRRFRRGSGSRSGTAVVEFAVLLPIVVVLVFGAIEMANGIFLKQAISIAAYEGARAATRTTGTQTVVEQRIRDVLAARGISNETVTITPSLVGASRGTQITVSVSVPSSEVGSTSPLKYLQNKTFQRSVVMVRL